MTTSELLQALVPPFSFQSVVMDPWQLYADSYGWILIMGMLVAVSCGLVGNFLLLRRMSLVGDAISHSVLPGLVIAFLISGSRGAGSIFLGALLAALMTIALIEIIHKRSKIKQDAAISISFSTLFAIGVVLISLYASKIDLDQDCVLYGEIAFIPLEQSMIVAGQALGPVSVVRLAWVTFCTISLIVLFYKELLVSSFDPSLAQSLGISSGRVHYLLMGWLSIVVVACFESVGAILVVAMLILPGATAQLLSRRLPTILLLSTIHALLSATIGLHLSIWLDSSTAAAMVVVGGLFFMMTWAWQVSSERLRRRFHAVSVPTVQPSHPS